MCSWLHVFPVFKNCTNDLIFLQGSADSVYVYPYVSVTDMHVSYSADYVNSNPCTAIHYNAHCISN